MTRPQANADSGAHFNPTDATPSLAEQRGIGKAERVVATHEVLERFAVGAADKGLQKRDLAEPAPTLCLEKKSLYISSEIEGMAIIRKLMGPK